MTIPNTYSLWLKPRGELYSRLVDIIKRLGREYHAPIFEPHVTLLSSLTMEKEAAIDKAARLAGQLRPYTVRLNTIESGRNYYRCVYILVAPTEAVTAAQEKARLVFDRKDAPVYVPHLSLLYGRYSPRLKSVAKAQLGNRLKSTFTVDHLYLVDTTGEPTTWREAASFAL